MKDKQSKRKNDTVGLQTDATLTPRRRRPTCEMINQAQNDYLSELCAKKVNLLSCRCSGCEGDDKYPVLVSPSDGPLLNTAYDGSGGFLTSGTDLHWEVGMGDNSGIASVSVWNPATVYYNSAWLTSPYGNANWISNTAGAGDDAYFRYRFNLASSADPATFEVEMKFYADNRVWEIYVNGVPQSTQPNGSTVLPQFPGTSADVETTGFVEGSEVHIKLDNSWRRCDNEIIVHVKSPGGVMGFLAQNAIKVEVDEAGCDCDCDCVPMEFPNIHPCISVAWGDTACDCMETDDVEVLCVSVCNCYSNVTFNNLTIGQIWVTDMAGNPVPTLPDGTPSVQIIPSGPICFGDIGPCRDKDHPTCVSRELVLYTRGAIGQNYKLMFSAICFDVCHQFQSEQCFTMKLCQD